MIARRILGARIKAGGLAYNSDLAWRLIGQKYLRRFHGDRQLTITVIGNVPVCRHRGLVNRVCAFSR